MFRLKQLYNKAINKVDKELTDPEAEEAAKQAEKQAKQEAEVAARLEKEEKAKQKAEAKRIQAEEKAKALQERAEFNVGKTVRSASSNIITITVIIGVVMIMMYGGHLASNSAIGYSPFMRVLMFMYGTLLFWYIIPKTLYDVYWVGKELDYYTFIPLTTYVPQNGFEEIVFGPFCYEESEKTRAARDTVKALYERGSAFVKPAMNV
jgi:cation transport ATPase